MERCEIQQVHACGTFSQPGDTARHLDLDVDGPAVEPEHERVAQQGPGEDGISELRTDAAYPSGRVEGKRQTHGCPEHGGNKQGPGREARERPPLALELDRGEIECLPQVFEVAQSAAQGDRAGRRRVADDDGLKQLEPDLRAGVGTVPGSRERGPSHEREKDRGRDQKA